MSGWVPKHRFGTAIYDFAPNGDFQVALQVGDRVEVFEESSGWCKGIVMKQPPLKGIFPTSFVNLAEENVPPPPPPAAAQPVTVGSDQDLPFYKQKLARLKNQAGAPASSSTPAASGGSELPAFQANSAGAAEQKKPAFRFTTATTESQPAAGATLAAPAQNGSEPSPRSAAAGTPTAAASVTSPRKPPPPTGARPSGLLSQPPLQAQAQAQPAAVPAATTPAAAAAPALPNGTEHGHAPISHSISFEALYGEISDCILEWTAALELHLHGGNTPEYHRVKERISALLGYRSKVMRETDPKRREALRDEIIQLIEGSRKMQEGYMVPRNKEGEMADTTNTGVVELLNAHRQMYNVMKEESSGVWHAAASRRRVESVTAQGLEEKVPDRRSPFPPGVMQLYLNVKMCIFAVGESTELFFSLYNEAQKRFITEDFYVALTEAGMPEKISLLNKLTTLFKDLDSDDFEGNLWLVCFIYRKGRLIHDPTKKKEPGMNYRRPFGCSVLNLADLKLETSFGKEHSPSPVQIYTPQQEEKFPIMHQLLIAKDMTGLAPPPKSVGIVMSLTLYHGEEAVVRENNKPKLPEADVPVTNKLDFPEAMKAADTRNDLYIFLLGGKFSQDNKTAAKNIEVIMRVCNSRGDTIPDCLIRGSGGAAVPTSEYRSSVFYHLNEPVLNETVLLRIPPDMLEQCHLYFSFWHVSTTAKKNSTPFAFGYQRLTTDSGAVLSDEDHVVITYTPVKDEGKNDGYYLKGDAAVPKLAQRKGEQFVIRSKLVSTKKTQNDTLTLLQKWRTLDINTLKLTLSKFLQMERGTGLNDYARFVRETFDALFGMLVSHHHSALHEVVFQAVFHLVALLTDRKASKFRSMVDSYISTIFAQPMVHHLLIKLTKKRLDEAKIKMDQSSMNFTKCFGYVIKLIVFSRVLDMQSPRPSCDDKQFKANFLEMFTSANALVSIEEYKDARYLLPSQTYLIRGFPELVDDLSKVFNASELGTVSRDLIAAIPNIENHTLNKLNLVRLLLNSDTGSIKEYRTVLFPIVKQTLHVYLRSIDSGSTNEPYLCLAILQRLLTLQQSKKHAGEQDVWDYSDLILDVLHVALTIQESHLGQRQLRPPSETVIQYCKVDLLQDSVTLLWSLVVAFGPQLMEKFVQSLSVEQLKEFSTKLLVLSLNCLTLKLYPEMWIVMNFLQLDLIAKNLRVLSDHLRTKLGPNSSDFSQEIWRRYFEVSLALLTIDALKVEKFSDSKKQFVLQRYGDIRMTVMDEVRKMWAFLGARQTAFIGPLVPALFDLAQNSVNADAKALAVDMYYDMVSTEFRVTKEFTEVERYTIDSLYNIANISQDAGDRFMEFLLNVMTDRLAKDAGLSAPGTSFLGHVHKMYTLMSSLLKFPDTAIYEDERTSVALRLMNYLEESAHVRKEMASRYVQYLVDLHVGLGNFVEAGMAQLYQIKLLGFTDNMLEAAGSAPVEAERQRKEHYFKAAISSFVQGDAYERAIALSAQLRDYYQYECYDYSALAQTLRDEASLFESIVSKDRVYASYFRVVYHGRGFDDEIRDKEFVYRGCQLEAIIDFSNRIKKKFPQARINSSSDAPSAELLESCPQVISLATLKPEKEESEKFLSTPEWQAKMMLKLADTKGSKANTRNPPRNVAVNRQNNDLIVFSLVKPIQKAKEKNPQNEFKHLWVQKTFLVAEESFPTNRRRVQVVSKWEILISPIETAVREVVKKNEELKEKTDLAVASVQQLGPLSMLLQGMIDAAVNGGTQKYISAFLDAEFLQENPEPQNARLQQELKDALRQQFELLKSSMLIFNRLKNDTLQGLFDHLNNLLTKIIAQTKAVIS